MRETSSVRSMFTSGGNGASMWSSSAEATSSTIRVNPTPKRLIAVKNFRRTRTFSAILM